MLYRADLTEEELLTARVQAEGLINSRLLTIVSSDAADLEPLTPLHFLIGHCQVNTALEVAADLQEKAHPRQRWNCVQQVIKAIWKRWLREIVTKLNLTTKWCRAEKQMEVGDVLFCLEDSQPRARWPLRRVVATHPGADSTVRVVNIRMNGKCYRRSVHRLVPLEVEPDLNADDPTCSTAAVEMVEVV